MDTGQRGIDVLITERPILAGERVSDLHSRFTLELLEPGFGYALGNSSHRILLSSILGAAVTFIRIDGVPRELRTIEGVKEDVAKIILSIKQIVLSNENGEPVVIYLRKAGSGEVLAGGITPPTDVEIHNPDLHFATLNEEGRLEIGLTIKHGRGYVSAAQSKDPQAKISRTPTDSIYSPVVKVAYRAEATRVQQRIDFDRLVIDVETKPAITPHDTSVSADKALVKLFGLICELNKEAEDIEVGLSITDVTLTADLALPVENLNLQSRSYNTLHRRDILTVGELVTCSEADLLDIRNFGTKLIEETKESLAALDMTLKGSVMPSLGNSESAAIFSDDQSI